jgi:hypothetical protein
VRTHFIRLLRHAWATVGLFSSLVTTRGNLDLGKINSEERYRDRSQPSNISSRFKISLALNDPVESRDSSVGVALGYGLGDRGSRVRFPAEAGNFSLHHRVQNGPEAHLASYVTGTGGSFPENKVAGG